MEVVALAGLVAAFAVVNGLNDGAALLAGALRTPGWRPIWPVLLASASVAAVPAAVGTRVAATLAERLVAFDGRAGSTALLAALLAVVAVVGVLGRAGLPTSLTLAVLGALAGAGLGAGLTVGWAALGLVLAAAAIAPVAAGLLGLGLRRALPAVPGSAGLRRGAWRRAAFVAQCAAYGANDGQKMLAVAVVAGGLGFGPVLRGGVHGVPVGVADLVVLAVLFGLGVIVGLPRVARMLAGGVVPVRPDAATAGQVAASAAVLAGSAAGAPISLTQATTAGLVGAGASDGYRRVRWRVAGRIASAWLVTLPAAGAAGWAAAAALVRLGAG